MTTTARDSAAPVRRQFSSAQACARLLAERIQALLCAAVRARGAASLVVPGGRTPRRLFELLSTAAAPWEHVWVTLSDERRVPADHPDSNERLVRDRLLKGPAGAARFVALGGDDGDPSHALAQAGARLTHLPRPFDAVVLGMGADGHVASLYPGDDALEADWNGCVAVERPGPEPGRISLTLPALLDSAIVFVLLGGPEKQRALGRAERHGSAAELPVRAILRQTATPVEVFAFA